MSSQFGSGRCTRRTTMADRTQRLAIVVTAQDLAAGKLAKVRSELAGMGTSAKVASVGFGGTLAVARKGEQAFGVLRGRIAGVAGAVGPLVGVGGLLGLTSLLGSSIS